MFASVSNAQEISIIGHGVSKHIVNDNYNERNYGAALRYQSGDFAIQAGGYHNSIYRNTAYVGIDWSPIHFNITECLNTEVGLYAGAATGYWYNVTPMGGIQVAVRCKNVFARVRAMPDLFYTSKGVAAVEIGFVLKRF